MTAYEVTQDLLRSSGTDNPAPVASARRVGRLRAAVTAGIAAGALILAVPAASAVEATAAPMHTVAAESSINSTLPSTITLTTRRTGSVIL